VINHNQSAPSIDLSDKTRGSSLQLSPLDFRLATNYFRLAMTSHTVGNEMCESTKTAGCSSELHAVDAKNYADCLMSFDSHHVRMSAKQLNRRYTDFAAFNSASRQSRSSSCTPHSIDDILSRPRRVHVTSLLLPESRRGTSGAVSHSWSSDEVRERVVQRTGDDDLAWKSLCWTQQSAGSHSQWTAATSQAKRGSL